MITLKTGTPGACKTLSAVAELAAALKEWETKPERMRPVYVFNVKDLALLHFPLPVYPLGGQPGDAVPLDVFGQPTTTVAVDWASVPDGAFVVIDECQAVFPPRGAGSKKPDYIAFLNTHRHRGLDLIIITQHPKLIDQEVRRLVGKHQHYRRLFGGKRSVCYEWDTCSDGLGGLKNAVTTYFPFPKNAFQWYKSAEVHTKQQFRLPSWIVLPVLGIVIGCVASPIAYKRISSMSDPSHGKANTQAVQSPSRPVLASQLPERVARVQGINTSQLPGQDQSRGVGESPQGASDSESPPQPQGCIASDTRCRCYASGRLMDMAMDQCRAAIHVAGAVLPLDQVPTLRGVPDVGPAGRHVAPVAMTEVRGQGDGVYRGRSPGERQDQAWQTRVIRQADSM